MNPANDDLNGIPTNSGSDHFQRTRWTVVLAAKQGFSAEASEALERLCGDYWKPLYGFVRRRGYSPHDAQDLTQEFFARLLAKDFLQSVDRNKGKFRSFLLAAMEHFLAKEWRRGQAQKRGAGFTFVSIDDDSAERPYLQLAANGLTPEQFYDQQYATTLLSHVADRLRDTYLTEGKQDFFEATKICLTGEKPAELYADLAAQLGTTECALKMAVVRMKERYRELLREEVAHTISNRENVEEELRAIISAVS
jgi:RNA polymerase sigma-70 factor (ECF subfamily)